MQLREDIQTLEARCKGVRFSQLVTIVERWFDRSNAGKRGSHRIYKTPWPGDPRINLQPTKGGEAKPYQVDQVTAALHKLMALREGVEDGSA